MAISFMKIRDVKSPKGSIEDAGIDFYVPEYNEKFVDDFKAKNKEYFDEGNLSIDETGIHVKPWTHVLIPSGIKSKFSEYIELGAANKSGVFTKQHLFIGAETVDSGYQGEIHLSLVNYHPKKTITISYGQKLVQFIPRVIDKSGFVVVDECDDFYDKQSTRGEGGFGSSGLE